MGREGVLCLHVEPSQGVSLENPAVSRHNPAEKLLYSAKNDDNPAVLNKNPAVLQ
jgi:hypothetical protein